MFEAFASRPRVDRARWMGASVIAHSLLLAAAWRAFVAVQDPAATVDAARVTFYSRPPPPPPPGGDSTPSKPKPKRDTPRKVQPSKIVAPAPEQKPAEEAPEEPGQAGGVQGGVQGGVVGGVVGSRAEFDSRMTPPRLISGPAIQYTDKALENDVEGLMIVRCVLNVAGEVGRCEVKQSVRFMDSAVVETLQRRRYTPVTLEGRPIEVYYTFRIRLNLPR